MRLILETLAERQQLLHSEVGDHAGVICNSAHQPEVVPHVVSQTSHATQLRNQINCLCHARANFLWLTLRYKQGLGWVVKNNAIALKDQCLISTVIINNSNNT